jgi:hypothetical protein
VAVHQDGRACIAGIWRTDKDVGEAFTILTTPPGPEISSYHERQIAVLDRADWAAWLDQAVSSESHFAAASFRRPRRPTGRLQKDEPASGSCSYDGHNTSSHLGRLGSEAARRPVPSHPLGYFEDKPAEGSEADGPEKHDRDHDLPLSFLHDTYDLGRPPSSNKLLRSNGKGD